MEKIKNYINGELVEPSSGKYIDNYNPASGKVYSLIPDSNENDINTAIIHCSELMGSILHYILTTFFRISSVLVITLSI